jgi:hypothetical protein
MHRFNDVRRSSDDMSEDNNFAVFFFEKGLLQAG